MTGEASAQPWTLDQLVARAAALRRRPGRSILGIVGAPGAGKSWLARAVVDALGEDVALVPMDGYHLANTQLERLGRRQRKGAPDTFDAAGYLEVLRRLRNEPGRTLYAPQFHRDIEESIAAEIAVPPTARLVLTEGNYLLHDEGDWAGARALLDEVWFVEVDDAVRHERLAARHVQHGKPPAAAREWALGSDERNAELIRATRHRADLVVQLTERLS